MIIDTCGLNCPQPVVLVLTALKESDDEFEIVIDSDESCSNISRLLQKFERTFSVIKSGNNTIYTVDKKKEQED